MTTNAIKQQLHHYLEVADNKKLKAIYTMVEADIAETTGEYTAAQKAELDKRVNYYLSGGIMVTPAEIVSIFHQKRNPKKKY